MRNLVSTIVLLSLPLSALPSAATITVTKSGPGLIDHEISIPTGDAFDVTI